MTESDREDALRLVFEHGWNTTCFQILNPGITLWFGPGRRSVVGYVKRRGVRVVAGAPVCALEELGAVVEAFESAGPGPVCYFAAESRLHGALAACAGYSTVVMGAQPEWHPNTWRAAVAAHPSLRAQLSRARNKGVTVEEWPASRVRGHEGLETCVRHWLGTRGLPPLHFLVEPQILDGPEGRRVFVALRSGQAKGFVALAPIPARNGWLTEMFVRGPGAPNGTVELALARAVSSVAEDGAEFVTMGMVPLSPHAGALAAANPAWLKALSGWSRAHMRRFYGFDGLDFFKSKFTPQSWEPIYVLSKERSFSVRTLYAVLSAFTGVDPAIALLAGMGKAVRQEFDWLFRRGAG